MNVHWQTYGATLFSNGLLLIDAAVLLPAFGYDWPPADPTTVPRDVAEIIAQLDPPNFSDVWLIDPQRN